MLENSARGWRWLTATAGESFGDYNDVVIEPRSFPEPGSLSRIGAPLAAMGFPGRHR